MYKFGFGVQTGPLEGCRDGNARQEVREAIQDLWKELRWLESHKPADEDARATLDDCLEAAKAALDDQQLIYVRPEVAAEKIKNITVDVKSTMAKMPVDDDRCHLQVQEEGSLRMSDNKRQHIPDHNVVLI